MNNKLTQNIFFMKMIILTYKYEFNFNTNVSKVLKWNAEHNANEKRLK